MKNMKIKTKLVTGFLLIALLTALVGGVGVYSITRMSAEADLLNDRSTMAVLSEQLSRNINQQRAAYLGLVAFDEIGDYEFADRYKETMESLADDFDALSADLDTRLTLPETKAMLSEVVTEYAEFSELRGELVALMERVSTSRAVIDETSENLSADANNLRQGIGEALKSVATVASVLVEDVNALTTFIDNLTNEQAEGIAVTARNVTILSIAVLIVAVVAAVVLGLFLAAGIARPVNIMRELLVQVGETGSFVFSDETKNKTRAAAQYRDEVSQSLAAFVKMMDQLIVYGEMLEAVAARDLTVRVNTLGKDDTMGNALAAMVNNLNDMFAEINTASEQVSGGS
ncbi:MAG: MCP four helix bundle domain-containing protein, partial [Clostridiales Family XIII bacterium]|nr:MCP four helix bundle domain-containing protein [Clostridiales Family XIII bacterium]